MATGGSERLYEEDDRLDERLLNQISKWIMYNRLPSLARHLGFSDAEISRILIPHKTPEEQCFQILKRWHQRNTLTMKEVVESMVEWQLGRCLDPGVWNHLRPRLNPRLMPAPSFLQPISPANPELEDVEPEDSETPYIVEMMSDEENTKSKISSDSDEEPLSKSVSKEKETSPKLSAGSCSVTSGNRQRQINIPTPEEIMDLQFRLKISLDRTWRNSLSHDWMPVEKAKTFPLREFYVGLRWVRVVMRAIQNFNEELTSIYEILDVVDPSENLKPTNILVTAGPGMGKTCSMAKLALDWQPGSSDKNNPLNRFDFLFLLRLCYADKKSSLAELIVTQHVKLEQDDIKNIEAILKGKTVCRVLLILDGYDEYKPGTNKDIDRAIEATIGNCFLILTSRPDLPSKEGQYVSKEIRDKMDGEVIIEGFTEESIEKCSAKYLENEEKSKAMLKQAVDTDIYVLLKVPILLLMVCVLFSEQTSLPQTRTKIVQKIFELTVERTALKNFESDIMEILNDLLLSLGELSWNALKNDVQQLLLKKDELEKKSPLLLKLGLLFEIGIDTTSTRKQPTYLSFHHKIFQEYSGAYFLRQTIENSQNVEEILHELFPSLLEVKRLEEVVLLTVGLMADPTPLIDHVYELWIERHLKLTRYGQIDDDDEEKLRRLGKNVNDVRFFRSLYKEYTIELPGTAYHNQYINCYFEGDASPVYLPSRLFLFHNVKKCIECFAIPNNRNENVKIPVTDSIFVCSQSNEEAYGSFNQIRRISQLQPISDMWFYNISCNDTDNTEVFNISHRARSIYLLNCVLPGAMLDYILQQMSVSSTITRIYFRGTSLGHIKSLSLQYLPSLTHLDLWNTNLCRFHILHLGYLMENGRLSNLMEMNLGGNNFYHIQDDVDILLQIIAKNHRRNIVVVIQKYLLPKAFVQKVTQHANESNPLTIRGDDNDQNDTEQVVLEDLSRRIYQTIHTWGSGTLLEDLSLVGCKLPRYLCEPILKVLSDHRSIVNLDLSGNIIGIHGCHLVNTIKIWGKESSLQELDLTGCSLPAEVCGPLLLALGKCRKLTELWLPGNALTACLQYFLADPSSKLPSLEELFLSYTKLNRWDLLHLTHLIRTEKMPQLRELDLGANNLNTMQEPLCELAQALVYHHHRELKLNLYFNHLSNEFKERIKVLCQNSSIELEF